jgi:DNA polymerase-1
MISTNINKVNNNNSSKRFSDKITIVDSIDKAKKVLQIMMLDPKIIWACDTEVADIDVKTQGPVGNGKVICISIYGGPDFDFQMGEGKGSALWVDNIGDATGVLNEFKIFFESEKYKKIWHNYSFDRHVMYNMNIDCKGFYADTMHMARLSDTSRDRTFGGGEGYSLASLSVMLNDARFVKESMKDLFGVAKLTKSGSESKVKVLPTMTELQTNLDSRDRWIQYSARDAIATWCVWSNIKNTLMNMEWRGPNFKVHGNMYDFYLKYLLDFGECLTDMERNGIKVDTEKHLKEAEKRAIEDRNRMEDIFRKWSAKFCSDSEYINR